MKKHDKLYTNNYINEVIRSFRVKNFNLKLQQRLVDLSDLLTQVACVSVHFPELS